MTNDMTMIRIRRTYRTMLLELASRIAIAEGASCSMTEALDMLLDHTRRHYTPKQLAERLLEDASGR